MRTAISIWLLLLTVACVCVQPPQPQANRFDADPEAEAAYRKAYQQHYDAWMAGSRSNSGCTFGQGGSVATASELGGWHGMKAAKKALLQQERVNAEQMSREAGSK